MKVIPEGLYSITYDPVGVDKEKNEITNKHSHNSIKVWMNPHYLNGFKQKLNMLFPVRKNTLIVGNMLFHQGAVVTDIDHPVGGIG